MRYAVLIIGLVGAVGSGYLGYRWMSDFYDSRDLLKQKVAQARMVLQQSAGNPDLQGTINTAQLKLALAAVQLVANAWPFLLGGAVLGLLGCAMAMLRRGFSAAALFFAATAGSAIFNPLVLIFTCALPLAGILALFVRPLPAEPTPES